MRPFENTAVEKIINAYPLKMRRKVMALRESIFQVAATTEGVGEIEETLKWGEPAYVTTASKSGSTIRIAWKKSRPTQYAMYFHCQTNLVETFKTLFPSDVEFEGNRAIVFDEFVVVPNDALRFCIAAALTYHQRKAAARSR